MIDPIAQELGGVPDGGSSVTQPNLTGVNRVNNSTDPLVQKLGGYAEPGSQPVTPIKPIDTPDYPMPKTFGGFFANLGKSFAHTIGDVVGGTANAVGNLFNTNLNENTAVNLGKIAAGGVEKLIPGQQGQEQNFGAFVNSLKAKYNNGFGDAVYNDPVGVAMDFSILLDGIAKAGSVLGDTSKISKAADAVNPITQATKGVGKVAEKGIGIAEAPFEGSFNSKLAETAEGAGIKLPVSAVSKNKFLQLGESIFGKGLFGGPIQEIINTAKEDIATHVNKIIDSIKPTVDLNSLDVGSAIKEGFEAYKDSFQKTKNSMYDSFLKEVKDVPATTSATESALNELVSRNSKSYIPNSSVKFYKSVLEQITGGDQFGVKDWGLSTTDLKKYGLNPEATFENLKQTRTDVGRQLATRNDPFTIGHKAELEQLYSALTHDMDKTVEAFNPKLAQTMTQTEDFYRQGINKINSKVGGKIEDMSPEHIYKTFVKPSNSTHLQDIKDLIGPQKFQSITDAFLGESIKNSFKDGVFDIKKFKTTLAKYDKPTMDVLIPEAQQEKLSEVFEALDEAQALKDSLKPGQKISEGSQTAYLLRAGSEITAPISMLMTGNIPGFFLALSGIAGDYAGSKLFSSPLGTKFLTEGFDIAKPLGRSIENAAPKIGKAANVGKVSGSINPDRPEEPSEEE